MLYQRLFKLSTSILIYNYCDYYSFNKFNLVKNYQPGFLGFPAGNENYKHLCFTDEKGSTPKKGNKSEKPENPKSVYVVYTTVQLITTANVVEALVVQ